MWAAITWGGGVEVLFRVLQRCFQRWSREMANRNCQMDVWRGLGEVWRNSWVSSRFGVTSIMWAVCLRQFDGSLGVPGERGSYCHREVVL